MHGQPRTPCQGGKCFDSALFQVAKTFPDLKFGLLMCSKSGLADVALIVGIVHSIASEKAWTMTEIPF